MKKLWVKISDNLSFVGEILKRRANDLIEIVEDEHDLLITESIPDESKLFIVIWDKHDVGEIESKIIPLESEKNRHRYVRGFFLKNDVISNPNIFIETIKEIIQEVNLRHRLFESAKNIKKDRDAYLKVGSLVDISKANKGGFDDAYGERRFTTLFIDKPMLRLMSKLLKILEEIKTPIEKLNKDYADVIKEVKRTGGIKKEKEEFDYNLVEKLIKKQKTDPVEITPILLTGETGVGKTLIAKWIYAKILDFYDNELKKAVSYLDINSSGLSPSLFESELFGHVKGAWTDAKTVKPGKALLALGGVLFFDEIGDLHPDVQPKVMKFLEEKKFTPEGWPKPEEFYTPLLVIAATNKNLDEEVKKGIFRRELYARFKHRIHVPSIEERKASLHALIDLILLNYRTKVPEYISREAIERFKKIKYEENWRGLERIVTDVAYRTVELGLDIILPEVVEEVSKSI